MFWRRLPCLKPNLTSEGDTKVLFSSRMDAWRADPSVKVKEELIQAAPGKSFTGEDAKEIWLDGWETFASLGYVYRRCLRDVRYATAAKKGATFRAEDRIWPFYVDEVRRYNMFREKWSD
jgi:hypothetical protein